MDRRKGKQCRDNGDEAAVRRTGYTLVRLSTMRIVFAIWFFAHGVAHLPGFLVSWRLWSFRELPYHTRILGNTADIGSVGIRVIGVGWLFAGIAFVALGGAALFQLKGWQDAAYVLLGLSLILSILGWPAARIGVAANIGAAMLLFASRRWGWL